MGGERGWGWGWGWGANGGPALTLGATCRPAAPQILIAVLGGVGLVLLISGCVAALLCGLGVCCEGCCCAIRRAPKTAPVSGDALGPHAGRRAADPYPSLMKPSYGTAGTWPGTQGHAPPAWALQQPVLFPPASHLGSPQPYGGLGQPPLLQAQLSGLGPNALLGQRLPPLQAPYLPAPYLPQQGVLLPLQAPYLQQHGALLQPQHGALLQPQHGALLLPQQGMLLPLQAQRALFVDSPLQQAVVGQLSGSGQQDPAFTQGHHVLQPSAPQALQPAPPQARTRELQAFDGFTQQSPASALPASPTFPPAALQTAGAAFQAGGGAAAPGGPPVAAAGALGHPSLAAQGGSSTALAYQGVPAPLAGAPMAAQPLPAAAKQAQQFAGPGPAAQPAPQQPTVSQRGLPPMAGLLPAAEPALAQPAPSSVATLSAAQPAPLAQPTSSQRSLPPMAPGLAGPPSPAPGPSVAPNPSTSAAPQRQDAAPAFGGPGRVAGGPGALHDADLDEAEALLGRPS